MTKYNFDFSIPAKDRAEANKKMQAVSILAEELTETELTKLAHVVKHNPIQKAAAKKFLGV